MKITVYNNDVSKAYRILQKKLNNEGTLRELKEREFFRSKGEKKRLERKRGITRGNPPLIKPLKSGKIIKNNVLCKYQRRYLHESI